MTDAPEMVPTRINDRWELLLPKHRATRPGWAFWEREALHALWCCIRPGDVVWDIGAEEGDQSALMASWGARVCLVESSARSWPWINATFVANGLPTPERMAVSLAGDSDTGPLSVEETCLWPSAAGLPYEPEAGFTHLNEAGETPIRQLDTLWLGMFWPTPQVVVIDTEGSELRILNGARALIAKRETTFVVSVHAEFLRERYGDTPDDLLVLMELAGYQARYLGYDHEAHWVFRPPVT